MRPGGRAFHYVLILWSIKGHKSAGSEHPSVSKFKIMSLNVL